MMRCIYVVEDDDLVRLALQGLLAETQDLVIRGYRSGDAFLAEVQELDPGVILLDVHMPGASGLDVLRGLEPFSGRFVVIVLTGRSNVATAVEAMKAGAADFVEKPYRPDDLLQMVDRAFATLDRQRAAAARSQSAAARIAALSPRERDVLAGLVEGHSNKLIAKHLALSPRTIEIYRANLMDKLGVQSLSEALRIAFAAGLLPEA